MSVKYGKCRPLALLEDGLARPCCQDKATTGLNFAGTAEEGFKPCLSLAKGQAVVRPAVGTSVSSSG